jgi:hypothetical protein
VERRQSDNDRLPPLTITIISLLNGWSLSHKPLNLIEYPFPSDLICSQNMVDFNTWGSAGHPSSAISLPFRVASGCHSPIEIRPPDWTAFFPFPLESSSPER